MLKSSDLKGSAPLNEIRFVTRNILRLIDTEIRMAHHEGFACKEYKLPSVLFITNMSNKEAQINVYSSVIHSLEERGFVVEIPKLCDPLVIVIKWKRRNDIAEKYKFILNHCSKKTSSKM